jgi:hypothetical protein
MVSVHRIPYERPMPACMHACMHALFSQSINRTHHHHTYTHRVCCGLESGAVRSTSGMMLIIRDEAPDRMVVLVLLLLLWPAPSPDARAG